MLGYHHSTVHVVGLLLTRLARPNKDSLTIQERETLPLSCSCSCFPSLVFWLAMLFWFCKCITITWLGIILPSRSGCPLELALTWGYHTLTIVCGIALVAFAFTVVEYRDCSHVHFLVILTPAVVLVLFLSYFDHPFPVVRDWRIRLRLQTETTIRERTANMITNHLNIQSVQYRL